MVSKLALIYSVFKVLKPEFEKLEELKQHSRIEVVEVYNAKKKRKSIL